MNLPRYLSTLTEITLSPKEVPGSRGWHMKDNWHRYQIKLSKYFDDKSNFGTRLYYIRLSCFVTQNDCRFKLFPPVKLAVTYLVVLISLIYEHPVFSSTQCNPTAVIWSRQGW